MSVFEISIRKQLTANDLFAWSNVYHVSAPDISTAVDYSNTLTTMELNIHTPAVTIHSDHVAEVGVPDNFVTFPVNVAGTYPNTAELLPFFVAVRVDFTPLSGRSGRKFYHMLVDEAMQANGQLAPAVITGIQSILDDAAPDFSPWLCNPTGTHLYLSGHVNAALTQHQFKRKWARRGVPGP